MRPRHGTGAWDVREVYERLFIGDIGDASEPPPGIDVVVNPSPTWTESTARRDPLRDGRNDPAAVRAAVGTVLRERDRGNVVLVCCQHGISHSAAVCVRPPRTHRGGVSGARDVPPAVQSAPGLVDVAVQCADTPDVTGQ